jgi:hypothetical protein
MVNAECKMVKDEFPDREVVRRKFTVHHFALSINPCFPAGME